MQSLLSRVSLKVQIGLLVVLAGLVFAGSSTIQTVSRHQVEASLEAASTQRLVLDEVDRLVVGLLEARRHEKNFLLRHDAQSQREHAQAVAAMTAALDGLTSRLPADQTEQQALAAKVREGVGRYVDGFRTMVGLQIAAGLDASDGPAGARIDEAVRRLDQPRLSVAFLSMRRAETAALTKPSPDSRAAWTELAAEFQRLADGTGLRGQLDAYRAAVTTALDQAQAARAAEKVMIQAHREILEPALNALSAKAHADMEQAQALADRIGRQARSTGLAIELGGIAVIVIVGWLLAHSIYRPVKDITGVMLQLADGQTGIAIPAQNRHDEVGDMARSVEIFRTAMAEAEHLRLEQEEERRRAARDRAAAILAMADDFEASVKTKVAAVDHATLGIRGTAQTMADRSQRSGSRSLDVGESARISNERANSVADATRQLALAINEIAQQVAHSTAIARKTVEDVDATANQMEQLAGSVQAIGDVVSMINAIASQTRMLALNATIEAARAGEAGKGFAVVAEEVKALANQTSKATEEISHQVQDVQDSSRQMAERIGGVVEIIRSLDEVSAAIAGAVQQQEAATHDIADNIDEVAHQADTVSKNVSDLSKSSAQTCAGTVRVIWSASSLADLVDGLTGETDRFLERVRAQSGA